MKTAMMCILATILAVSVPLDAGASVVGLEGDHMTWDGSPVPPSGTTAPASLARFKMGAVSGATAVNHPVLVILVEFADQAAVGTTEADWESAFFSATGSVWDYYDEVSYGQLSMTPAVESFGTLDNGIIGWLPLDSNHPNTGDNTGDPNRLLTRDALIAADPYIDYSAYDSDDNGAIDFTELSLVVIAAGYERSYSSSYTPNVWGHRWSLFLTVPPPVLDGVRLADEFSGGGYMQYGEMHGAHMATIGIMVHEMGHDLGLPDLYDIDGGSEGIGEWGVMGSGSWGSAGGYAGSSPSHICAWSKAFLGYLTPVTVSNGTGLSLPDVAASGVVYRIDTIEPQQYFLLENRQPVGYDQGLPITYGGVLIWHIDDSVGNIDLNTVNMNENRKRVDVEEAEDNVVGSSELDNEINRGDQEDLFYSGNNSEFDDATVPDALLYGNIYSGVSISNVSVPGNPMTLDVSYTQPVDGDGDGFYAPTDCDDGDPNVYPNAPGEVPGDGIDTNCNGNDDCFIATAAFGTTMEGKIDVLRDYRDRILLKNGVGAAFVSAYYRYSPPVAEFIEKHGWLRNTVRTLLLPLIGFASLFV